MRFFDGDPIVGGVRLPFDGLRSILRSSPSVVVPARANLGKECYGSGMSFL